MTITRNFSVLANGAGSANNLSLGGATLGSNALAVTGTTQLNSTLTAAAANFSGAITAAGTGGTLAATISMNANTTGEPAYFAAGGTDTNVGIDLNTKGTGSLRLNVNSTVAVTVANGGKVGIGMTPSYVLDITQNQNGGSTVKILNNSATANASAQFQMSNGTTNSYVAQFGSSGTGTGLNLADCMSIQTTCTNGMRFGVNASTPYIWYQGSSERGRIDGTSANLFWGSSSAQSGMDNGGGQIGVARGIFSSSGNGLQWGATSYIIGNANSTVTVISAGSGGVQLTSGATAWASASDETMKTDLILIQSGAEKVASLRAMTGRYKTDEEGVSRSFLIAQDVQKVLPEAVIADADGTLSLRYTEVIPLMVAAIQELTTRLAALEAK